MSISRYQKKDFLYIICNFKNNYVTLPPKSIFRVKNVIKLKENEKISSVADHSFYGGMSKYRPVR